MDMKAKVVIILLLLVGVVFALSVQNSWKMGKKYNLILVSFDALQAKHLHMYGYPRNTTPNLDVFLGSSYLFSNTISPAPWTVPAHMSIFTSMYPSDHKVVNKFSNYTSPPSVSNLKKLTPNAIMLAEILQKEGYATAGFTGDAGVGAQFGFNQGFDSYYDAETFGGLVGNVPRALDWLKQNKEKPFFLFLHGYDIHGQYAPKAGFDYRYIDKPYTGIYTGSPKEQAALREEGLKNGFINLSDTDIKFWRAIYDEKINRADLEFKYFMDSLQRMGIMENTIVVVFSDHGTEFYEHKRFDHGFSLYGELVNVLFAIHMPRQNQGMVIHDLVSTIDILPTVLQMLGVPNTIPKQTKGIDLTPAFSGKKVAHDVFAETDYRLYTFKRSIETPDGWKFILTQENGVKELYNLNQDPGEQTNLIMKNPIKAFELEQKLQKHMELTSSFRTIEQLGCLPVYADQCQ